MKNRRQYLKIGSVASVAMFNILPSRGLEDGSKGAAPMDKLNVACIGCGGKG
ncbi:hypothetical protein [Pontiella sulfatireligans]|uniref:Uncharacterized protein n=1 Tax=Pontiella sulfatireligans TaxID=2750658 RepID=A0A6C2UI19_9BACT|nr:hypothetical protein [Pontiella sulfatireligans]VGO19513.1 hypothetical protein SCARR_01572 [Pontiella sulfatireligans]